MTHVWLREIDNKKIVGAILLDFTVVFDSLRLEKLVLSLYSPCYIVDRVTCLTEDRGCFLMEAFD